MITIGQISFEAGLVIAAVTLLGLIFKKASYLEIIEAVTKVMIGYSILIVGSNLATKQLSEIAVLIESVFLISGIMPNNELIASLAQWFYGKKLSYIMIFGMILHILIARYTRFKHIFLTGHHILFMAALITGIITGTSLPYILQILLGSIILAFLLSSLPRLSQPFMNQLFPENEVGLAHFGNFGFMLSGYVAQCFGKRLTEKEVKTEANTTRFRVISDPNVIVLVFMFSFILFLLFFSGNELLIIHQWSNNAFLHAFKNALIFTSGMYIIIIGVRMMLQEVLESFQGIAQKLVPNAIPSLDSPIIFPVAPQAVVIGFFSSIIGGVVGMILLITIKVNVVLPAIIAHFFSGGTTGVFGYTVGGYRGAVIGSFLHGFLICLLPLLLMPVMHQLGYTHTTFSETDFGVIGFMLDKLFTLLQLY